MLHTARIHLFLLFAKELLKAQGNIIYRDILRQRKAPQDLICMASVLGKLKTLGYLRDEKMGTFALQWRTAKCLPVKKFFWCCFQPLSSRNNSKKQRFTELQEPAFAKETQELTNKRRAIKKDFFVFWTFKKTSFDLN